MRTVGLKTLKNKLSEYVRLAAAGETVVITDRGRTVAELGPPRQQGHESVIERGIREGLDQARGPRPGLAASGQASARAHFRTIDGRPGEGSRRPLVIYIDSSVALARLLFEPRSPPVQFWQEELVSSRLLEYEIWNRVHAYDPAGGNIGPARALLRGIKLLELERTVLARALEPWPAPVRTLDALHLATVEYLRRQGETVEMASYDSRLLTAAQALGVPIAAL